MGKVVKIKDRNNNQLLPITRAELVEMNNGDSLQIAYNGINSTHYTKTEIDAAGYLTSFTETDPTVPSYVKSITQKNISDWTSKVPYDDADSNSATLQTLNIKTSKTAPANSGIIFTNNNIEFTGTNIRSIFVNNNTNYKFTREVNGDVAVLSDLNSYLKSDTLNTTISSYATSANYDSNTKKIYLKHGTTILSEIDATDFIKDGMIDTAYVQGSNLVISFNTDAGKEAINVPIASIFNANNYYTKSEIDNAGYLTSFTETDPTVPSHVKSITQQNITDWNNKLSSETQLSKETTTGSGNAVTDISVSNHQITLTKGSTFLTSHQDIKTINNQTITGTGNVTINELPTVSSSDNGKVLQVVNGVWTLVSPVTLYSGSSAPNNSQGNNGDIYLQI